MLWRFVSFFGMSLSAESAAVVEAVWDIMDALSEARFDDGGGGAANGGRVASPGAGVIATGEATIAAARVTACDAGIGTLVFDGRLDGAVDAGIGMLVFDGRLDAAVDADAAIATGSGGTGSSLATGAAERLRENLRRRLAEALRMLRLMLELRPRFSFRSSLGCGSVATGWRIACVASATLMLR